jgi:hypothetical protein
MGITLLPNQFILIKNSFLKQKKFFRENTSENKESILINPSMRFWKILERILKIFSDCSIGKTTAEEKFSKGAQNGQKI